MEKASAALSHLSIVMVETSHPGNIGAAARAMLTMGVKDLRLVAPRCAFPSAEATARACGAVSVLENAKVYAQLAEAIADCTVVVGTSARRRSFAWPALTPRECAARFYGELLQGRRIAIVFGREDSGLSNDALDLCHFLLHIPSNPAFSSLNVAAAVQIVTYEFFQTSLQLSAEPLSPAKAQEGRPATSAEMESFYAHLWQTLFSIGFFHPRKAKPSLMRRLRHLFNRAKLSDKELHILRGILHQAQERIRRLEQGQKIES